MGLISGIFKSLGAYVTGEALVEVIGGLEHKVEHTRKKAVKAAILYGLVAIGVVFLLIGGSLFIPVLFGWPVGTGFLALGLFVMFVAVLVKAFRK